MFNIFKRKYKWSEWLEGVMAAESLIQCGYTYNEYMVFGSPDGNTTQSYLNVRYMEGRRQGCRDYLDYYENNLK